MEAEANFSISPRYEVETMTIRAAMDGAIHSAIAVPC